MGERMQLDIVMAIEKRDWDVFDMGVEGHENCSHWGASLSGGLKGCRCPCRRSRVASVNFYDVRINHL